MVVSHIKMHFVSECVSDDFSTFFFIHSSLTFNANFRFVFLLLPLLLLASSATISNDFCGAVIECKRWDNGGANAATTPLLVTAISTAMVSFMFLICVRWCILYICIYIHEMCRTIWPLQCSKGSRQKAAWGQCNKSKNLTPPFNRYSFLVAYITYVGKILWRGPISPRAHHRSTYLTTTLAFIFIWYSIKYKIGFAPCTTHDNIHPIPGWQGTGFLTNKHNNNTQHQRVRLIPLWLLRFALFLLPIILVVKWRIYLVINSSTRQNNLLLLYT